MESDNIKKLLAGQLETRPGVVLRYVNTCVCMYVCKYSYVSNN